MPKKPEPTRADYLAELDTHFLTGLADKHSCDEIQPGEFTVDDMLIAKPGITRDRARDILRQAQAAGDVTEPVYRKNKKGLRVLAWARKV